MTRLRLPGRPPAADDDDRALLDRFTATGDETAFAVLVDRHGPLVLGVCRRVLRDTHLADDAFQATFLILARKSRRARPSLSSWLFGVARRVSLAARRRELRHAVRTKTASPPPDPKTPDWDDLLRTLDEELDRLPDRLRAPVLECYFREKTQDEAAKALGWSLSTLRRRLDRAKDLLRLRLTRRGATLTAGLLAGTLAATPALAVVPPVLATAAVGSCMAAHGGGAVAAPVVSLAQGVIGMTSITKWVTAGLAAALALGMAAAVIAVLLLWAPVPTPQGAPNGLQKEQFLPPDDSPAPADPDRPAPDPSPDPAADRNWATIRGRIHWPESRLVPVRKIDVTTDREHCLSKGELFYEDVIVSPKTRGVKNVVVWLRPDTDNRRDPFPREKIHPSLVEAKSRMHVIDQPCCQFEPRVLAARAGDRIEFRNSAPVAHNVSFVSDSEAFNFTLPAGKSHVGQPLAAQTTPIPFRCDIHPWMQGRVRVFDHPYFAVSDAEGNFEIRNAPAGKWRLVIWHENGYHRGREGALGMPVEMKAGAVLEVKPVELELPKN
jgi:RNA polymerase sigma factor (sigma-70 family)